MSQLNIDQMMEEMYATTTASKSACPSPDDYMKSFEGAENIVVVTITGTLSGSYNSAEGGQEDLSRRASEYQYPRH